MKYFPCCRIPSSFLPGQYWRPWGLLVCPVNLYPNTPSVSSVDFQQSNISKLSKLGCSLIYICTFSVLTQLMLANVIPQNDFLSQYLCHNESKVPVDASR